MATSRPAAPRGSGRLRRGVALALLPAALAVSACTQQGAASDDVGENVIVYTDEAQRPSAPQLSGEDLDGEALDTGDFAGDVVVVNFWASWCAPCRREAPDLAEAAKKTEDDAVTFVGVNVRDSKDKARGFDESLDTDYPSFFDPSGRLAVKFDEVPPNTIPATIVIDDEGRIAAVFRQEIRADTLIDAIKEA